LGGPLNDGAFALIPGANALDHRRRALNSHTDSLNATEFAMKSGGPLNVSAFTLIPDAKALDHR